LPGHGAEKHICVLRQLSGHFQLTGSDRSRRCPRTGHLRRRRQRHGHYLRHNGPGTMGLGPGWHPGTATARTEPPTRCGALGWPPAMARAP
jgi:hypothetical protein